MKNIGILGSTGSVGKQTLDVIKNHPDKFKVIFLTAHSNFKLLFKQAEEFKPKYLCISNQNIDKTLINKTYSTKFL